MSREIIGITGPIAAGKDTAANYLSDQLEIPVLRISDPIREVARRNGLKPTRENLVAIGTAIAKRHGDEYLAQYLLERERGSFIVTGIRQLGQVAIFGSTDNFRLIAIDADPKVRFERMLSRGKPGEAKTFEQFMHDEAMENSSPNVQRVHQCMEQADSTITNNGSVEKLYLELDDLMYGPKLHMY